MGKLDTTEPTDKGADKDQAAEISPTSQTPKENDSTPANGDTDTDISAPIEPTDPQAGHKTTGVNRLKQLLRSKKFYLYASVGIVLIAVILVACVEPLKFAALNLVTKGSAEFVIVDDATLVPVEKVAIAINGKVAETNKQGKVTIKNLKFGTSSYTIKKENYTTVGGSLKVKPGTNLAGPLKLHSQGTPFTVTVSNKLSKQAVTSFKASIEGSTVSALSDAKGTATIKIPSSISGEVTVLVSATGFNDSKQKVTITRSGVLQMKAELTPSGKHYFLSNRSGKVAVLAANLDGSNQTEVIPGIVADDSDAQFMIAPDGKHAALVSRRDNQKNANGDILPALFAIDLEEKTIKRIDEGAPFLSLLGWSTNNQIVYSVSYDDYNRADNAKLKTADVTTSKLDLLYAQSGYVNFSFYDEDKNHVYFINQDQTKELYGVISVDIKTKSKKRVFEDSTYQLMHAKPYTLAFKFENSWRELNMKTQQVKAGSAPSEAALLLTVSPQGEKTAWVENRDGKGTIITGDAAGSNPKQVTLNTNATGIVRWVSEDYVIYSTQTNTESTEYIVHLATGTTTKLSDVYSSVMRRM